jgi:Flp pilus assembly protein TadD
LGKLGKWHASLEMFDKLVKFNPKNGFYQTGRGVALAKLDRMVEAEIAFNSALILAPGSVEPLLRRAVALCDHNRPEEALDFLIPAVKIAPNNAELHYFSGVAHMRLGRSDVALAHFDQALLHNPDHANAGINRDEALRLLRRH